MCELLYRELNTVEKRYYFCVKIIYKCIFLRCMNSESGLGIKKRLLKFETCNMTNYILTKIASYTCMGSKKKEQDIMFLDHIGGDMLAVFKHVY